VKFPSLFIAAAMLLSPLAVQADNGDWRTWPMGERLKISGGVYEADLNTEMAVTEVGGLQEGTAIDFEDDLGLDDSESASFTALTWRVFKRHVLNFNYYSLERDARAVADDGLVFDDLEILPGDEVDTFFDVDVYELSYAYSILFDEKKNLSIGLGLAVHDFDLGIASVASPVLLSEEEDFTAPLPTFKLGFDYAITDKWLLGIHTGYLDIDFDSDGDEFDARIFTGDVGLRWKAFDHASIGLHYSVFDLEGDYEDDDIVAMIDLDYRGPRLSLDFLF